eukprot:7772907-Pyramimonas_sp.AAC.1
MLLSPRTHSEINHTVGMASCQFMQVSPYQVGYIQLPYVTNIRAISMWLAPYKDGGYAWEYIFDARSGLGSGWYSFLNTMSSISSGSNWHSTIYVNGIATDAAGLVSATSSASTTYAPW